MKAFGWIVAGLAVGTLLFGAGALSAIWLHHSAYGSPPDQRFHRTQWLRYLLQSPGPDGGVASAETVVSRVVQSFEVELTGSAALHASLSEDRLRGQLAETADWALAHGVLEGSAQARAAAQCVLDGGDVVGCVDALESVPPSGDRVTASVESGD